MCCVASEWPGTSWRSDITAGQCSVSDRLVRRQARQCVCVCVLSWQCASAVYVKSRDCVTVPLQTACVQHATVQCSAAESLLQCSSIATCPKTRILLLATAVAAVAVLLPLLTCA